MIQIYYKTNKSSYFKQILKLKNNLKLLIKQHFRNLLIRLFAQINNINRKY